MDKETNTTDEGKNEEKFDYERFFAEEAAAERAGRATRVRGKSAPRKEKADGGDTTASSEVYDWLQCLVSALIICVVVFAFFARIIGIIGSSMVPTFHDSDKVVISNLFFEPKQGDVVVLRKLQFQDEPIIKRVIATEGQTVDIDFEEGIVYVDGKAQSEPYVAEPTYARLDFDAMITVPEGQIFVMGDNRNHSTDSRESTIGCVDKRYILGKVLVHLFPLSDFEVLKNPHTN